VFTVGVPIVAANRPDQPDRPWPGRPHVGRPPEYESDCVALCDRRGGGEV